MYVYESGTKQSFLWTPACDSLYLRELSIRRIVSSTICCSFGRLSLPKAVTFNVVLWLMLCCRERMTRLRRRRDNSLHSGKLRQIEKHQVFVTSVWISSAPTVRSVFAASISFSALYMDVKYFSGWAARSLIVGRLPVGQMLRVSIRPSSVLLSCSVFLTDFGHVAFPEEHTS